MNRFLAILLGLVGIVIVVSIIIASILWVRVPSMLSRDLSQKMGVAVSIDSIGISPTDITVDDLYIGNPLGSILPKAFTAKTIDVNAPLTRYLNDNIVIDEIDVKDIYLGLEFNSPSGTNGNWTEIMGNFQKSQAAGKQNKNRTVLIKKIVLTNINVDVVYKTDKKIKHLPTIDRMELTNVSSTGGFPTDQIMNSVLGQMLKSVFTQENLNNMLKDFLNSPSNPAQKYLQPFQGLFPFLKELDGEGESETAEAS